MTADFPQNFFSFDTETIDGYARLGTVGDGNHYYINALEDLIPIIETYAGTSFFCWNMKFDMQGILKYLPLGVLERLWSSQEHRVQYNQFVIKYIQDKEAIIRVGNKSVHFYDLAQFFKDPYFISLDAAAKKYLGKEKMQNVLEQRFKDLQRLEKDQGSKDTEKNKLELEEILRSPEFVGYAQKDAELTQELLDLFLGVAKQFGVEAPKYYSPASLGVAMTKAWLGEDKYPSWYDDGEIEKIIAPTCRGGVFEALMLGDFGPCMMFDIRSAYPAVANLLPHWNNGDFVQVQTEAVLQELLKKCPELHYGWGVCRFSSEYIPYQTKNKKILYLNGERTQAITFVEYLFLKEIGHPVEWLEGVLWIEKNKDHKNPFGWIGNVYNRRKQTIKGTMENYFLKIVMNGVTGKIGQKKGRGTLKNLAYYSYCTAETRVALFRKVLQNGLRVIFYATDGVLVEGILLEEKGKELGEWETAAYDRALVVGVGRYELEKNGQIETKARGLEGAKETGLRAVIEQNRNRKRIPTMKVKPVGLGDIVTKHKKFKKDDLNLFKPTTKHMDIRADTKLRWEGIETFGDLLGQVHIGQRFDVGQTDVLSRSRVMRQTRLEASVEKTEATTPKKRLVHYLEEGDLSTNLISEASIKTLGDIKDVNNRNNLASSCCKKLQVEQSKVNDRVSIAAIDSLKEGINVQALKASTLESSERIMKEISKTALKEQHDYQEQNEIMVLLDQAKKQVSANEITNYNKFLNYIVGGNIDTTIELVGGRLETCIDGKQVLVPYYEGGKNTGIYQNRNANRAINKTVDNLYVLNQAPFFPRANGALMDIELTTPHSERAMKLTADEILKYAKETVKRFWALQGWKGKPVGNFYNVHLWSSLHPLKKHAHVHVSCVNARYVKETDSYIRVSSKLTPQQLKTLKELWFDVLRKYRVIQEGDMTENGKVMSEKTIDVCYHFTPLSHREQVKVRLRYQKRSVLVDLENYYQKTEFDPTTIDKTVVEELVKTKNMTHIEGVWNNISKVLKPVKEKYCSLCGGPAQWMDVSVK